MRISRSMIVVFLVVMVAAMVAGCGGGSESGKASTSSAVTTMPVEGAPFGDRIAAAGYEVVQFREFPAQIPGRKANAVVYRSGSTGGVLYTATQGNSGEQPAWHWYFDDGAPDSVSYLELNDDGLWDVRVYFGDEQRDFIQESDFSFFGRLRSDVIATNATASEQDDLWKAFDGDTSSTWTAGGNGGWMEVRSPLGLRDGVLVLQMQGDGGAAKVAVKADGKQVDEFDLEKTTLEQIFQLGDGVMAASVVRLEFSGGKASVAEMRLR